MSPQSEKAPEFSLAEQMIVACSEAFRDNGEILSNGIGPIARLGASLAKKTHSPELLISDSEAFFVEEPVPIGPRGSYKPKFSGYFPFARVFDCVWHGERHVMIGPVQIDRWGQTNLSGIGSIKQPKIMQLGLRGLPGNSINHMCSMIVMGHSKRIFVEGQVDILGGLGYRTENYPAGLNTSAINLHMMVSNLCVMDFKGPNHQVRVKWLHPGVSFEEVQEATGFPLYRDDTLATTPAPTAEQLAIIQALDPHNIRSKQLKDNPPGIRAAKA